MTNNMFGEGGGGGRGGVEQIYFSLQNLFFDKYSCGSKSPNKIEGGDLGARLPAPWGSRWVGKRYTSSYDHDP